MANEKSPEEDRLPKEFYANFKEIIISKLSEIYNNTILSGRQPISPKMLLLNYYIKKIIDYSKTGDQ